jgi:UPF0716 family protein affecting phage T7 exclusion
MAGELASAATTASPTNQLSMLCVLLTVLAQVFICARDLGDMADTVRELRDAGHEAHVSAGNVAHSSLRAARALLFVPDRFTDTLSLFVLVPQTGPRC